MFKTKLLLATFLFLTVNLFAQRGSLGNQSIGAQDTWVNTYAFLTSDANSGDLQLTVNDNTLSGALFSGNLNAGDLILIIQMQGATMDINTDPIGFGGTYTVQNNWTGVGGTNPEWDPSEYGQVTNYNNAGNFEYIEVGAVSGSNIIELNCGLTKNYTAAGHVQIVRIPRFEDLTVSNGASITAPNWNGSSGGVIALEVNGDLVITGTGTIAADDIGFRGGIEDNTTSQSCSTTSQGYLGSFDISEGAEKGEGIGGFYTEYDILSSRYCYGAVANGGGGANYHNAGGGGGANVGVGNFYGYGVPDPSYATAWNLEDPTMVGTPSSGGGRGGYTNAESTNNPLSVGPNNSSWSGDCRRTAGGTGAHALTYDSEKIFMGGGGGAGDANNNYGGQGGRGGGIVMVQVYGAISGTGSITANGQDGEDATGPAPGWGGKTGDDGAGGAGGGGAIHISNGNAIPAGIDLIANGGNGGDQNLQFHFASPDNQADGPGGAGAGGMIAYSSGTPTESVSGGIAGSTNSSLMSNFPLNGATGGGDGMSGLSTTIYDIVAENDTICGGGSTTLTANVIGTLPTGGTLEWYNSAFGGTSIGSGANFTTPNLATTTSYFVGVCPGTYRVEVEVVVSPAITISGTPTITPETCAGNDGSIIGLTASGGFGTLTFDWNGTTTPSEDLMNAVGGNYTLTVTDQNGCTATSGPHTIGASPGPSIDLSGLNIQNETCLGNDGSITGIVANGSNITIEWNGTVEPDEDITGLSAGTYTLVVTDNATCTATAGPFTVNLDAGPTIDETNISISDETCVGNDGAITGVIATGTNLTYEWNSTETISEDTVGLSSGTYTLVVTDDVGCSSTSGPHIVNEIPGPIVDDSNINISDEGCNQGNGSITGITATGNNLSFVWNGTVEPNIDINNLSAGSYTLEVVDNLGCSVTVGPYTVQNVPGPVIDVSNAVIEDVTCNGNNGGITGITSTGNGLTFEWNGNPSPSIDLTNASAGNYGLQVTDENGCTDIAGPFLIDSIPAATIDDNNLIITQESCVGNDGEIYGLQVTGNGLTFEWNGQTTPTADLNNASSGDYTLEVTDVNGCVVTYGPVTIGGSIIPTVIASPINSTIDFGGSVLLDVEVNPTGGAILWSPSEGLSCINCENPTASPEQSGWYVVIITSLDGCLVSDSVFIEVIDPCGETMIPTVFSPNEDGLNDQLCVLGGCIETMSLQIFNRWGEKVFESNEATDCWDGTFNGKKVNTGTFIFKLNGTKTDGSEFNSSGNINVIR
jgi:gliding motility-associated-like protein